MLNNGPLVIELSNLALLKVSSPVAKFFYLADSRWNRTRKEIFSLINSLAQGINVCTSAAR